MSLTPVLTKRFGTDQPWKIDNYERLDGYAGLRKALGMERDVIVSTVKDSNLRGRGGAGFPTGMKWQFIPQDNPKPKYVVVNADEGEPGTCRDLPLMMNDPHAMIEGILIACFAVRANHAFIYIRGEAVHAIRRVTAAVEQARAKGYVGPNVMNSGFACEITVHAGSGAYICGEETALLDSLEGRRGQPRLKPPFPATNGLYDAPTVVNNVGTLASVPAIILGGADWFKKMGPEGSPGPNMYSLSDHREAGGVEPGLDLVDQVVLVEIAGVEEDAEADGVRHSVEGERPPAVAAGAVVVEAAVDGAVAVHAVGMERLAAQVSALHAGDVAPVGAVRGRLDREFVRRRVCALVDTEPVDVMRAEEDLEVGGAVVPRLRFEYVNVLRSPSIASGGKLPSSTRWLGVTLIPVIVIFWFDAEAPIARTVATTAAASRTRLALPLIRARGYSVVRIVSRCT